jgi:uncharacterized protein YggE
MRLKNRTLGYALAFATLALIAGIFAGVAVRSRGDVANAEGTNTDRTVSVGGEGRVSLAPDTVYITVGVDEVNVELGAAQSAAAAKMDAVIAALKGAGVADKDIQTSNYSIYMERDYNQPTQPITGYHVTHTVNAKVRDINNAGATIEAAVNAGANNIQNVSFGLEDQAGAMQQARELAVADAKAKAGELARLTESTLGPVLSISENVGGSQPVPYNTAYTTSDAAGKGAAAPSIDPGQSEVVMTVQVTYALN